MFPKRFGNNSLLYTCFFLGCLFFFFWQFPQWVDQNENCHFDLNNGFSGWNTVENKYFCKGWPWNPSFMLFPLLHLLLAPQTHTFPASRARNDQLQLIWAENEELEFRCDFLVLCWAAAPVAVSGLGYHHLPRSSAFWLLSCLASWFWSPAPQGLAERACEVNYPSWFGLNKLRTRTVGLDFIFGPLRRAWSPGLTAHPCCACSLAGLVPARPAAYPAPRWVHKIARLEPPLCPSLPPYDPA